MTSPLILFLSLLSSGQPLDVETTEHALNGEPASGDAWAFVVDISVNGRDCTGTLISETLVLTAAHCVVDTLSLEDVSVVVTRGANTTAWRAAEVGVHPQFCGAPDCDGEAYDFGYVRLERPQQIAEYPRLLRTRSEAVGTLRVGVPLIVAGFGLTSSDAILTRDIRRVASVEVRAVTSSRGAFTTDGSYHDTCFGDSGGPALAVGDNSEWVLVGVLSAGLGEECGDGALYGGTANLDSWLAEVGYTDRSNLAQPLPKQSSTCSLVRASRGFEAWALVACLALSALTIRQRLPKVSA